MCLCRSALCSKTKRFRVSSPLWNLPFQWSARGESHMNKEIYMPAMEMAQDKGTLVHWLRQEGEYVQKGEPLFLVETDKVSVEIEATGSGYLANVKAQAGDKVPVGQ